MSISSNLKAIRTKKGMTQGNLAEKAGIELTQVSRIERGASEPKLETIKRLAIALSCTTDELIMDEAVETSEYIKRTVKRIADLTPLRRFVILNIIHSYCNDNDTPEPSLYETKSEGEYEYMRMQYAKDALIEDLDTIKNIREELDVELHICEEDLAPIPTDGNL
ncbi:helix-turn-helix domain-containing protein [Glaciecola sp. 1036]|uniref:helix-turn-helix domain-containing protein n=1 Tax=Alteromonadaceae TaxID=72275 RepID=UPI003CFF9D41